jgi:hypothetical protein
MMLTSFLLNDNLLVAVWKSMVGTELARGGFGIEFEQSGFTGLPYSGTVRGSLGDCLTRFIASFQTGDQLILLAVWKPAGFGVRQFGSCRKTA